MCTTLHDNSAVLAHDSIQQQDWVAKQRLVACNKGLRLYPQHRPRFCMGLWQCCARASAARLSTRLTGGRGFLGTNSRRERRRCQACPCGQREQQWLPWAGAWAPSCWSGAGSTHRLQLQRLPLCAFVRAKL